MSQKEDLQKQIAAYQRRLSILKEREAKQGLSSPPEVLIEIEDIEEKLANLNSELQNLGHQTEAGAVSSTSSSGATSATPSSSPFSTRNIVIFIGVIIAVAGCLALVGGGSALIAFWSSTPTPTITPTATETPEPEVAKVDTNTPVPTDTPTSELSVNETDTPTPEPLIIETDTPAPTYTPTRIPSPTPVCTTSPVYFKNIWESHQDALGCPDENDPATVSNFTYRPFDRGTFAWQESNDTIYMLLNNKTWKSWPDPGNSDPCPEANNLQSEWKANNLELTFQFGFRTIWCEKEDVRNAIGNPTSPDENEGKNQQVQNFDSGTIMTIGDGKIYILYDADNRWEQAE